MRVEDIAEEVPGDALRESLQPPGLAKASLAQTQRLLLRSPDFALSPATIPPLLARANPIARMWSALRAAIRGNC